ncbi:hypothetical protein DFH07DRAFT_1024908 [Mycena maculata]|uniref:Uncharacterized protein n=1 Tax=Mycena maculata TaxID=230809 RepID=A0AAD7NE18_9AGAR|nr:hypothetical protein DFH07DRAFT_1024908 [Mycena maculata]
MASIFPPELEREIFETTAILHPQTMPTLLPVAHRVLIWIEPLLYRFIILARGSIDEVVRRAMRVKPASFLEASIRHICISSSSRFSKEELCALLRLCTKLVSLTTSQAVPASELLPILAGMTQVRKWTGSLVDLFGGYDTIDLSHPFFRYLTHMDIIGDFEDDRNIPSLVALPALTHLALCGDGVLDDTVPRVLEQCTQLQVLVIVYHAIHAVTARQIAARPPTDDLRFVVCVYHNYLDDQWKIGVRRGTDFWSAAETFIARKRRGEIGGALYEFPIRVSSSKNCSTSSYYFLERPSE